MSKLPHRRLFLGESKAVVISGAEIQVLESETGAILHSTLHDPALRESLLASGPIRCVTVDSSFTHLAIVGDDKKMRVLEVEGLGVLSERELPKKPTDVQFTRGGRTILTSDKFGDVFSYPLHPVAAESSSSATTKPAVSSHDNPSGGRLILGHTSLLTSFVLTPDEKYVITADRDEHIRVSWYPQGYNIERYCLGHEKFVSALHIPPGSPTTLISGGGDPTLKFWDWQSGTLMSEIRIFDDVEPYIKVKVPRDRRMREDDEGEQGKGGEKKRGRKDNAGGRTKNKGKARDESASKIVDVDEGGPDVPMEEPTLGNEAQAEIAPAMDTVFALHKITTVGASGNEVSRCVIFSVVGASALFSCPYASFPSSDTGQSQTLTPVRAFDFGKPVLDFVVVRDEGNTALIWALVDAEWGEHRGDGETEMVRAVRCFNGEFAESDSTTPSPLLSSLNSKCLIPATPASLSTLDLYAALVALPKNVSAEYDPMDRSETGSARGQARKVNGKEMGKMRTRKALVAAMSEKVTEDSEDLEQGEGKKLKSEDSENGG